MSSKDVLDHVNVRNGMEDCQRICLKRRLVSIFLASMYCDQLPTLASENASIADDAGYISYADDGCDDGYRSGSPRKAWRNFRLLVVSTAGATRAAPYMFMLVGNNMTELELVELKYRVMEGWKSWFADASFKPLRGKLTPTMKSAVIEAEDLRVKLIVGATPSIEGGRMWSLLGAEGEDYGYWNEGNAKVLFNDKNVAFNADTVID
ncbi:hypothetical protein BDN71DRAFT_1447324 [Pleurotus eryngii]|uniref:Uncharacterized protein n=1 Tax=Pleurotus eryngii TaxID=5323 RepID=A0A9P5ZYV6_PLEER|nr:hypothetical protein BDN71DRAFT_1447324 [Pleurotus eryngii]